MKEIEKKCKIKKGLFSGNQIISNDFISWYLPGEMIKIVPTKRGKKPTLQTPFL